MKNISCFLLIVTFLMAMSGISEAVLFTGSDGPLSASVEFTVSGTDLIVTLSNTSSQDILVPSDVLTAVFFDISGSPVLTKTSAVLNSGSSVYYDADGQPAGGIVGGEWAYARGLSGGPDGAGMGISSSGLGLFGPGNLFPGPDLQSPVSPDGVQYGLLSAGDNVLTGNGGITGSGGLIKNSVVFTISGLPEGFDSASISNISFQYGTSLSESNIQVPEPSTLLFLGAGLIGLGVAAWRKTR